MPDSTHPKREPHHAKGHQVPGVIIDHLAAVAAITKQQDAIRREREALAAESVRVIREIRLSDNLRDLAAAIEGFKIVYGKGWTRLLKDAGLPDLDAVQRAILGIANDGPGRWRGTFPVMSTDPRPNRGTWVVYQLLAGDDLLYIGSTGSFLDRVKAHARDKEFDNWRAAECESERHCRDLETALINRYRPPLNRMIPTPRLELVP